MCSRRPILQIEGIVAIKFFDPDYQGARLPYRLDLFEREFSLLQSLSGGNRMQSVKEQLTELPLSLVVPGGHRVTIVFRYFVTEWLEGEIENYFFNNTNYSDEEKLEVYRECCLAVFALHRLEIAHRDVKPDNFRSTVRNGHPMAIAIDLGTAVAHASTSLGSANDYRMPIGARAYAPLETFSGPGWRKRSRLLGRLLCLRMLAIRTIWS